jgi:2-amino-4-hydroxy-6-hydroxymethyldihydropteridine diphosphokinase
MLILGLGSNLSSSYGDRFYNIDAAIKYLEIYGIKLISKSSYYETPSYPDKNNPKFINVVISAQTKLPPEDLASVLLFIEEKLERKRKNKNDPRTCDIDIIDYNNQVLNLQYKNLHLAIPHRKLIYRNFVLFPLQEIAPSWKHPNTEEIIGALIHKLPAEDRKSILKVEKN